MASDWFQRFEGAGLDGVVGKAASGLYEPDKRVMYKVKHERECDCVVAGFRWYKESAGTAVGSLLLGLFDRSGSLHHVGVCASFTKDKRRELLDFLAPYRINALDDHPWRSWAAPEADPASTGQRMPGGQSRWSQGKDLSWEPLRPELVVEVSYEHMQGLRFRHMAHFRRWRTDKRPADCTYEQLEVVPAHELTLIFSSGRSSNIRFAFDSRRPGFSPFPSRVVVRIGSLLRWSQFLWHVAQVHPDTRPGRRPASHAID